MTFYLLYVHKDPDPDRYQILTDREHWSHHCYFAPSGWAPSFHNAGRFSSVSLSHMEHCHYIKMVSVVFLPSLLWNDTLPPPPRISVLHAFLRSARSSLRHPLSAGIGTGSGQCWLVWPSLLNKTRLSCTQTAQGSLAVNVNAVTVGFFFCELNDNQSFGGGFVH